MAKSTLKFHVNVPGDPSIGIDHSSFTITLDHNVLECFTDDPEDYKEQLGYLVEGLESVFRDIMDSSITIMEYGEHKKMIEAENRFYDEMVKHLPE